jgi:putative spermidine/putrescine transport system substrate-binding protein
VSIDVAFATMRGYPELREIGALLPIDYSLWDEEALKGVPESARHKDAVLAFQSANMLVYDKRAFDRKAGRIFGT